MSTVEEHANSHGASHASIAAMAMSEGMVAVAAIGRIALGNMVETSKAQTFDFMESKHVLDMTEATGMREMASEENPGGPSKPA